MARLWHRFTAWLRREHGEIDFERDVPPHDPQRIARMFWGDEARSAFYEDGR